MEIRYENYNLILYMLLYKIQNTSYTAVFEKVYRTILQSKRRRLVFKTGVIMYIQNDTLTKIF